MRSTCRDCGRVGSEDPDDPAPNLCPPCYEARLNQITPKFEAMCDSLGDPFLIALWLEDALHEIGGETPAFAHKHAQEMLTRAMLEPLE